MNFRSSASDQGGVANTQLALLPSIENWAKIYETTEGQELNQWALYWPGFLFVITVYNLVHGEDSEKTTTILFNEKVKL